MASVRDLAAIRELGLRCLAGHAGLDAEVRWVHFSEIPDPVAWLRGGELLVTVGLMLEDDAALEQYLRCLAAGNLSAVGFGVGVKYDAVPQVLLPVANELGLPLLEVPMATPYVAISEAVSSRIAQKRQRELTRAVDAQRDLTRAALDMGGAPGTLAVLNRSVGCWAAVTTPSGDPISAVPAEVASRMWEFAADLDIVRNTATDSAMSLGVGAESIVIQALGAAGRRRRFLVAGKEGSFTPTDRLILSAAVTVLSLEAESAGHLSTTQRFLRDAACEQLLRARMSVAERATLLSHLGLRASHFRVAVAETSTAFDDSLIIATEDYFSSRGLLAVCFQMHDTRREEFIILTEERTGIEDALEAVATQSGTVRGSVGVSQSVQVNEIASAHRQAEYGCHAAAARGVGVLFFDRMPMHELFLDAVRREPLDALRARLLTPLQIHDETHRGDLVRTVQAYLNANGRWEPTARALQVHRQTLRNRISTVSELLHIDLELPDVRAAFWLVFADMRSDGEVPDEPEHRIGVPAVGD